MKTTKKVKTTFALLCITLILTAFVPRIVHSKEEIPVLDIEPEGMLGPGDPRGRQLGNKLDEGGIYIVKEPDERWHVVGAGMLPWGGTQVDMIASAVNAGGSEGKIEPEGEYTNNNPGNVFDSPDPNQIDWIKIEGNRIEWVTWYNGTGGYDGVRFQVEGDYLLFERLGFTNKDTVTGWACGVFGDRECLAVDPLLPAPVERIFIGADNPEDWEHPPKEAPFALKNVPKSPTLDDFRAVEPMNKLATTWGEMK